jgi:hypothetical protein
MKNSMRMAISNAAEYLMEIRLEKKKRLHTYIPRCNQKLLMHFLSGTDMLGTN